IVVDGLWAGTKVHLICVYAPGERSVRTSFFADLAPWCTTNRRVFFGGDFNEDILARTTEATKINQMLRDFELKVLKNFPVTWQNTRGVGKRLDYMFVSSGISIQSVKVTPTWFSDHVIIWVEIGGSCTCFGRGVWKLNTVLQEHDYIQLIRDKLQLWVAQKSSRTGLIEWWEGMKRRLKGISQQYCTLRACRKNMEVWRLQKELQKIYEQGNCGLVFDVQRAQELKVQLKEIQVRRARDFLFSLGDSVMEQSEDLSSQFFRSVWAKQVKRNFEGIRVSYERVVRSSEGILEAALRYFGTCFQEESKNIEPMEEIARLVVNRSEAQEIEGLDSGFELLEVEKAMRSLGKGKVLIDGVPVEFYLTFWDLLGLVLVEVFEEILKGRGLSESMRQGVPALLYKKGDSLDLSNWRPQLLCVDYKVLAKVLCSPFGSLISRVAGRSISWNFKLIRDSIAWAFACSLDQEKAFDKVHHTFVWLVLQKFCLSPRFVNWLNVGFRVCINGHLGGKVQIGGGVRQGCRLSPLLYILYVEPLLIMIRSNSKVDGLCVPGSGGRQESDDVTLLLSSEFSLQYALETVNKFGWATGSKINRDKNIIKIFGKWRNKAEVSETLRAELGPIKILGVEFGSGVLRLHNWETQLNWRNRRLSYIGKVQVIKMDILPMLVFLANVFSVPTCYHKKLSSRDMSATKWGYHAAKERWKTLFDLG
uniref:Uncharacterized protein n=1 Tax=Lepisosteus oculatus TaxID=7918 RepID=W5N933_LEPOC